MAMDLSIFTPAFGFVQLMQTTVLSPTYLKVFVSFLLPSVNFLFDV